ncbi:MAG: HD domain-containing protein [Planctomycetaceae bacterium]|jgi:tRNA nucleotidyltransferase (CCA-adding enzyme)|nr:HD domain-containing protein [Planctomycetaceae bacterium]
MPHPLFQPTPKVRRIIELLFEGGASDCLFVGGYVRDIFLEVVSKERDIDIEVYGLTYKKIIKILRPFFHVNLVGQSFGTIKIDNEIDLSIPRTESKWGVGHKGFAVSSDPNLDPYTAFSRRDFTMNAIGLRPDGSIYDPFDGLSDLKRKILRAPTQAFCEDPLRVLRGMQFVSRFGFEMELRTIEFCRTILSEFTTLSAERILGEWKKWAIKGRFPSKGLELLKVTGWVACFPELAALMNVPQNPVYHPEGDAFTHTALTCNAAATIAEEQNFEDQDRMILLFAAICHDFGKPATTILNKHGVWVSPNHAFEGVVPATQFLERLRAPNRVVEHVRSLVREHLAHTVIPMNEKPDFSSVRRLANRLEPTNIRMWSALCRADSLGCGAGQSRHRIETWEEVAEKLEIRDKKPIPILQGRDLLSLGVPPGPKMGKLLHEAYEHQLDGFFCNHDEALNWIKKRLQSNDS